MSRHSRGYALLPVFAGLLLSCGGAVTGPVPEVEYGRCREVYFPGPVCVLWPDRRVHLWVKADPDTQVEIRAGGRSLDTASEEVEGGRRYKLPVPDHASSLTVLLRRPDGSRSPNWVLALADSEIPAWLNEIGAIAKSSEIRKRLFQLRKEAPRKEQGLVLRSLGELDRQEGNGVAEEAYLKQAIAADRAERCLSGEVESTSRLLWLYLESQGRFRDARRLLESLKVPSEAPADAKFLVAYYQGLLADRTGNYSLALEQLRAAIALVEKVRRIDFRWQADQVLARLLQDLGRSEDAWKLFSRTAPQLENPCDRGLLLTNRAWARLLRHEAGEVAGDPMPDLEKARAEVEKNDCRPAQRLNIRINLALAHLHAGRLREARQALEQARELISHATLRQLLWWHDLEARVAIDEGDATRALRLYEKLEKIARRASSFEGLFRASLGRANALIALGQRAAALEALAEADHRIDEQAWNVPAHEGRDTLVAQRTAATRLYLSLLLQEGQRERAFNLVRRARSRLLRQFAVRDRLIGLGLAEQQRWEAALAHYEALRKDVDDEAAQEWQLLGEQKERSRENRTAQLAKARADLDRAVADFGIPEDDGGSLARPRPGEVILIYHPLPEGWVGFAADESGIEVNTFELPDRKLTDMEFAGILLQPFRRSLERAERVRVLPYGRLRSVDFHTLPFAGEPLLARRLVIYGLDLPVRPVRRPLGRSEALLVVDPQGDLPAAREEATEIEGAIRSWGPAWALNRLDSTTARAEAVRKTLPDSDLFHYAGHGTFAGFSGWDSLLSLADGSILTLSDVLALRRAPAWVVLSSCDAARSSEEAPGEGIGLANAFLLAGSQAVIAATRKVPDHIARDLSVELYRGWQPGGDLSRQFQRAQRICRERHLVTDCASFRLLEP
jgi:tetratricopeptide (TPR) repeat protein